MEYNEWFPFDDTNRYKYRSIFVEYQEFIKYQERCLCRLVSLNRKHRIWNTIQNFTNNNK